MKDQRRIYSQSLNNLLNYISDTYKTESEIEKKLDKVLKKYIKDVDEKSLNNIRSDVLNTLKNNDLINDQNYSDIYVEQKMNLKNPKSKIEISNFLFKKRVGRNIIDTALQRYTDEVEVQNIKTIALKKSNKSATKLRQYLIRKGFNPYRVSQVLNNLEP